MIVKQCKGRMSSRHSGSGGSVMGVCIQDTRRRAVLREANAFRTLGSRSLCKGKCFQNIGGRAALREANVFKTFGARRLCKGRMHDIRGRRGECLQDIGGRTGLGEEMVFKTFGVGTICKRCTFASHSESGGPAKGERGRMFSRHSGREHKNQNRRKHITKHATFLR